MVVGGGEAPGLRLLIQLEHRTTARPSGFICSAPGDTQVPHLVWYRTVHAFEWPHSTPSPPSSRPTPSSSCSATSRTASSDTASANSSSSDQVPSPSASLHSWTVELERLTCVAQCGGAGVGRGSRDEGGAARHSHRGSDYHRSSLYAYVRARGGDECR